MGTEEGESVQTTTNSLHNKSLSPKKLSKSTKGKTPLKISIEDARRNWPFTRLDGALLEKLHKQVQNNQHNDLGEALL